MTGEEKAMVREVVIREGAVLLVMAAVLWYTGPGKIWVSGMRHQLARLGTARGDAIDVKVGQFRAEVSRWEHEQAAQQDR